MDKYIENIKKIMIQDKNENTYKNNIEKLYVWELADKWIDSNIKNEQEFKEKLKALGGILNEEKLKNAIEESRLALKEKASNEHAINASELVKNIKQAEEYAKNSEISGYKILNKYEDFNTYKTDSFIVHTNIMKNLYKYLKEMENKSKINSTEN